MSANRVADGQPNGKEQIVKKSKSKKSKDDLEDLKKDLVMTDHKLTIEELTALYHTDLKRGLTSQKAREVLEEVGPNKLKAAKGTNWGLRFLADVFGDFNALMWIGGILCFISYGSEFAQTDNPPGDNLYLGIVLCAVATTIGAFIFFQEFRSSAIMDSFKDMVPPAANVIRDGEKLIVPVSTLTLGDLVEVKGGDRVPADIRIIFAQNFKVDNSSLTGESEPQSRNTECTSDNPLETRNLAFFSSNAVEGVAQGIVVRVGPETVIGRIATLTDAMGATETPLAKEMKYIVYILMTFAIVIGIIFLIITFALGYGWLNAILFLIGVIVANVPEGLVGVATAGLTLTAKRMAAKNCLVKNLQLVESLGSVSVICSDKTGTLTQNRMTVAHMWFDGKLFEADTTSDQSEALYSSDMPSWQALSRVATLCNRAEFKKGEENVPVLKRECSGDASESALLKCVESSIGKVMEYREKNPKICEIPFNSTNKFQVSIHKLADSHSRLLVMKGAPERILDRCSTIFVDGKELEMTDEWRDAFNDAYLVLGGYGERVLGFCDYYLPEDKFPANYAYDSDSPNFPLTGLRFVGLMSMIDPPRQSVPDAVVKCRQAGIKVIMVTGDHPITAKAIAKAVGIISDGSKTPEELAAERMVPVEEINLKEAVARVVHGGELKDMSALQLDTILSNHREIVFARTSPQQKLLIVEGCQRQGWITAVTGDGVNDSPALKKADIGIAMGIAGSEVSKQAAGMILMDDNFSSIITGVEEGRTVFENLKKSIVYIVAVNIPELIPFLYYVIANVPLPLGVVQMLLICLGTDLAPAISLGYEKPEVDIMYRPPRHPTEDRILSSKALAVAYGQIGLIETAAGHIVYYIILAEMGFFPLSLFNLRVNWENNAINDMEDSYGQEWTWAQRNCVQLTCYSGYFMACVLVQWANIIGCKTRRNSIITQGMNNYVLIGGLFFETILTLLLTYCPGTIAIKYLPLRWIWFIAPLPYCVVILAFYEIMKLIMRHNPKGWIAQNFAY